MQKDLKRLVAYSSVAHLGFIVLGTFALTTPGHDRAACCRWSTTALSHRRAVPPRRLDLRAAPHPRDLRAQRPAEGRADLRRRVHAGDALVDRPARPQRLRRRVPRPHRHVPHRPLVGGRRRHRRDPRRPLPALGLPAGVPRRAHEANRHFPELQLARRGWSSLPLVALIVFIGVYPKPVLDRIQPSVDRLIAHVRGQDRLPSSRPSASRQRERLTSCCAQAAPPFIGPDGPAGTRSRPLIMLVGGGLVLLVLSALLPGRWPRGGYAIFTAVVAGIAAIVSPSCCGTTCRTTGPRAWSLAAPSASTGSRCSSPSSSASPCSHRAVPRRLPAPRGLDGRRVLRPDAHVGLGRRGHGVGQRPHRAVPRPRDAVDRALRPGRQPPAPHRVARRRASSTSCSAASRRRSSSTASPSSTAPPGRPTWTKIVDFLAKNVLLEQRPAAGRHRAPARRLRLQGGGRAVPLLDARRVPGRARRRSPGSWPRPRRRPAFAALLRVFVVGFASYETTGSR